MPSIGDNLSDKFQAILDALTGMSAVQTDLLNAQIATNAKLDALMGQTDLQPVVDAINAQTIALGTSQLSQADVTAAIDQSGQIANVFSALQGIAGGTDLAALLAAINALQTSQLDQAGVTAAIDQSGQIANVFSALQGIAGGTDLAALLAAINALQTSQLDQAGVTAAIDQSGQIANVFSALQGIAGGTDLAALLAALQALRGADQRTLTDLFNKPTAELVGDVTIDVTGVEQRLDQMSLNLVGSSGDSTDIRQAIWNLAGPAPGASLVDLLTAIQAGNAEWDSGAGITAYNLLDALRSEAVTRNNLLQQIDAEWDAGAGITPYNLLDSIRSEVIAMVQCCEAQSGGVTPPPPGDEGACAGSEYVSSGMEEITDPSSNETGIVATWSTVPDHVQLFDGRKLAPGSTGWDGYSVWVQSTATSFRLNLVDSNRYPTNQWIDLSSFGSTLLFFAVDVSHSLSVTLCVSSVSGVVPNSPLSIGGCQDIVSSSILADGNSQRQGIIWPASWPRNSNDVGLGYPIEPSGYVLQCNLSNHTCQITEGIAENIIIRYSDSIDGGWNYHVITTDVWALPENTVRLLLHRISTNLTSTFTLRLCRA
jgi:hypothetical protein